MAQNSRSFAHILLQVQLGVDTISYEFTSTLTTAKKNVKLTKERDCAMSIFYSSKSEEIKLTLPGLTRPSTCLLLCLCTTSELLLSYSLNFVGDENKILIRLTSKTWRQEANEGRNFSCFPSSHDFTHKSESLQEFNKHK